MKAWVILCAALVSVPAWAVNKCVTPQGKVVFQDTPCDVSSKSSEKVKVWNQQTGSGYSRGKNVEANPNLEGPAQAKPLLDLYRRWSDAEKLALSTGRIALSGPIASMQAIQREAEAMSPPACLEGAHKYLVELTKKSTQGMMEFMGKQGLEGMLYTVVDRRKLVPAFEQAIANARCE